VRVVTGDNSASCGYRFVEGEELVIFARSASDVTRTDTCTLTGGVTRDEVTDVFGPPKVNPLGVQLRRGDVNADGRVDISDPIANLLYLFDGGFETTCLEAHDFENNGTIELTDAIAELTFLFGSGAPPAPPFEDCGKPVDLDTIDCDRYPPCPPERERNEVVRIEHLVDEAGNRVVEVELFSTRPVIPRALIPTLCIGGAATTHSSPFDDGDPNKIVFTYPASSDSPQSTPRGRNGISILFRASLLALE